MYIKKQLSIVVLFAFFVSAVSAADSDSEAAARYRHFRYPPSIPPHIRKAIDGNLGAFFADLQQVLSSEKENLLILVDKRHPLPEGYTPPRLVTLKPTVTYNSKGKELSLTMRSGRAYIVIRKDLSLTETAEQALHDMALAARQDGVELVVSSTYRSYQYQKGLFARYVRESGEKKAERFSARAGTSQHQLGTVIDFDSITNEFAETRAGKWMADNASHYGWSLSFPKGYEKVTGYIWESWHYRYIGTEACAFQQKWFGGIQQYMLEFIDAWKKTKAVIILQRHQ